MKTKLILSALLFCILSACIALTSCSNPTGGSGGTHTVRYEITGPQTVARIITYSNETGNVDSITNVPIPWEKTLTIKGSAVVLGASFDYGNNSTYTAKIFVNGKEVATANSSSISISVSTIIP